MKTDSLETEVKHRIAEEAAGWFLRLRESGHEEGAHGDFQQWLNANEIHRHEYLTIQRLWGGLDNLRHRNRRRRTTSVLTALLLISLATVAGFHAMLSSEGRIETKVAETRQQVLDDGTIAELDADSQLLIDYSPWRRLVVVLHGQVQFKVAAGLRPFEVRAAGATVRDIGTTFNLYVRHDSARISVQEGIVEVTLDAGGKARRVNAGQQLDYLAADRALPWPKVADAVPPWREGRWVFEATPLDEVIEEINRHHARPAVLADPRLGSYRVSGVFEQVDRKGLLQALVAVLPLRLEERSEETLIRQR
uniref:FecR protein n=1 Tax=Dechloromonas aromatica (strain RCB) TaxID=159087 RepID=Q47F02_DECAR